MNEIIPDSPATHDSKSPIWESEIVAIEVFYPGTRPEDPLIHMFIVRDPTLHAEWQCDTDVAVPGMTERCPRYTTKNIEEMIKNVPVSTPLPCIRQTRKRQSACIKICRARVCSVQVLYNYTCVFLDRCNDDWHTWRCDTVSLTTSKVLAALVSA